jgi:hypothetical protein
MSLKYDLPLQIGDIVYHITRGKCIVSKIDFNKEIFYVRFLDNTPRPFMIESFDRFFRTESSYKIFLNKKKKFKSKKKVKKNKKKTVKNKEKEKPVKEKKTTHLSLTKDEKNKILALIENNIDPSSEFKFEGFYHMTTLDNFISIANDRMLLSRSRAKIIDDMSKINDITKSVISKTSNAIKSHVRFYFRPKTPTYYHFENSDEEYCLLKFDREIMFNKYAKISRGNAAKKMSDLHDVRYNDLVDINFRLIFLRSGNHDTREELDLNDSELLIPHYVMLDNVREYIFRNNKNRMYVYNELKKRNIKLPRGGKFVVDNSKFIK